MRTNGPQADLRPEGTRRSESISTSIPGSRMSTVRADRWDLREPPIMWPRTQNRNDRRRIDRALLATLVVIAAVVVWIRGQWRH